MTLRIVDVAALSPDQRAEAARILRDAFAHMPEAFPGDEARTEVESFLSDPDRSALAALDGETLVGWVGVIETYSHAWELHPLAVYRRQGYEVVGLIPDANGPGKPDILMAKRL